MFYVEAIPPVRLGLLISVWTPHVSANDPKASSQHEGLYVSIFPERDNSCHLEIDEEGTENGSIICKTPLGYNGRTLPELMALKSFIEGGHDVLDCKILVCVKSIGHRKRG